MMIDDINKKCQEAGGVEEVSAEIEKDIVDIVERYKKLFVLELVQRPDNAERYMLRPRQYVFEFFYNYINTSTLVKGLKEKFCDNISVKIPDVEEPVTFTEIKQNGFFTEHSGIPKEEHEDGSAMQLLYNDLDQMENWFKGEENHVLFAKYNWHEQATDESGSEFVYAFHEDDKVYLMSSDGNRQIRDYGLSDGFRSIISLKLNNCVIDGAVADENALAEAFEVNLKSPSAPSTIGKNSREIYVGQSFFPPCFSAIATCKNSIRYSYFVWLGCIR